MKSKKRYSKDERRKRAIWKRRIVVISLGLSVLVVAMLFWMLITSVFGESEESEENGTDQSVVQQDVDIDIEAEELVLEEQEIEMEPISITLSFAGDCTLGTDLDYGYSGSFMEMADNQSTDYFFSNVKDIFEADDLTVVNLEGPLTDGTQDADKTFAFRGEIWYTDILTEGSVEVVDVANNHSYDYGTEGYEDTLQAVSDAGIVASGYENTQIVDVNGVQVGLVGMYELAEGIAIKDDMIERIESVKESGAQVVIVSFHWGTESQYYPESTQTELAYAAIDNGADLVVGHHPHVLQGIEEYNGKYIVYSLGNFCFGGNKNPSDKDTIIYQQTFTVDETGVLLDSDINIIPCSISSTSSKNNFQPTPLEGDEKTRVADKLQEISMTDISAFISE